MGLENLGLKVFEIQSGPAVSDYYENNKEICNRIEPVSQM